MATFRDSEKQRYQALKGHLFSAAACRPGAYNQRLLAPEEIKASSTSRRAPIASSPLV